MAANVPSVSCPQAVFIRYLLHLAHEDDDAWLEVETDYSERIRQYNDLPALEYARAVHREDDARE